MLIMPSSAKSFQALADNVARNFLSKGVSIEDGVVKLAVAQDMTPEEVRRLVEKSNTAASILFLKNAQDKKASFKLASVEDVLRRTHPEMNDAVEDAVPVTKTRNILPKSRSGMTTDVPVFSVKNEKTAACVSTPRHNTASDLKKARAFLAKRKQEKVASQMFLQKTIDSLSAEYFGRKRNEFGKLASDAIAAYGTEIKPLLESVADYLGTSIPTDKTASYIDDTTRNMRLLKKAAEAVRNIRDTSRDIVKVSSVLNRFDAVWHRKSL